MGLINKRNILAKYIKTASSEKSWFNLPPLPEKNFSCTKCEYAEYCSLTELSKK